MTADKRAFVAGATGVIGRVLCKLLVADGWHVVGTTRKAEAAPALETLGVEPAVVDVFDAEALRRAVVSARPVAVIHQLTDLPKRLAAHAAHRALLFGDAGIYNVAEPDGTVSVVKATRHLGWSPAFRAHDAG